MAEASRKTVDLRSKVPTRTPAAAPPVAGLSGRQGPPLPAYPVSYTEYEKKGLEALGLPTDRPLPPGLAEEIARLKQQEPERFEASLPDAVNPAQRSVAVPPPQDLSTLTPEHRQQLQQFVSEAVARQAAEQALAQQRVPGAPPGVNEAIEASLRGPDGRPLPFVNDMQRQPAAASGIPQQPAASAPAPAAPSSDKVEEADAGGLPPQTHCPHCNWDLHQPSSLEIDDADKLLYLAHFAGAERFRKQVSLGGGALMVGFRSLLSEETDLAYRQVMLDAQLDLRNHGVVPDDGILTGNLEGYLLALGLDFVDGPQGRRDVPALNEAVLDAPPPGHSKLRPFYEAVVREFCAADELRRVIGDAHHKFRLTLNKLSANVLNPSFWPAIGARP